MTCEAPEIGASQKRPSPTRRPTTPFDGQVDGGLVRALEELLHACQAAGYLLR
jgi:hypothetical protein